MKTLQDAIALSKKKGDSFYVSAFVFQAWLGEVVVQTNTEYAEKKNPKDRSLQSGQAWAKFQELFSQAKGEDMPTGQRQLLLTTPLPHFKSSLHNASIIPSERVRHTP